MKQSVLAISLIAITLAGCAGDQKRAPTSEEVAEGEALPPAPPVPAQPASTDSPTAPTVPGGAAAASAPAESPPAVEALTEAQIARLGELVNTAEIDQGKLAQRRAKRPAVQKFAAMMVKHHGEAQRQQAKLVKKLNLAPAESAAATTLKADAEKTLAALEATDAAGFDAAYLQSQVDGHRKVLELIDSQAMSSAKTPEVVEALRKGRMVVEQHLNEARALQSP